MQENENHILVRIKNQKEESKEVWVWFCSFLLYFFFFLFLFLKEQVRFTRTHTHTHVTNNFGPESWIGLAGGRKGRYGETRVPELCSHSTYCRPFLSLQGSKSPTNRCDFYKLDGSLVSISNGQVDDCRHHDHAYPLRENIRVSLPLAGWKLANSVCRECIPA